MGHGNQRLGTSEVEGGKVEVQQPGLGVHHKTNHKIVNVMLIHVEMLVDHEPQVVGERRSLENKTLEDYGYSIFLKYLNLIEKGSPV